MFIMKSPNNLYVYQPIYVHLQFYCNIKYIRSLFLYIKLRMKMVFFVFHFLSGSGVTVLVWRFVVIFANIIYRNFLCPVMYTYIYTLWWHGKYLNQYNIPKKNCWNPGALYTYLLYVHGAYSHVLTT